MLLGWNSAQLLVSGYERFQPGLDHSLQFPDHCEVGVDVPLFLPVEDLLPIQVNFEAAIRPRGEGNGSFWTKSSEKFVGHPRGRGVVLSSDAVQNVHKHFPLWGC